ncbi:hypothetical protein GX48_05562 [Paracoccidioides brasiliensis]|nr:hypothetical protein GX48_05562 [Paracoccidioides brasiliensis]
MKNPVPERTARPGAHPVRPPVEKGSETVQRITEGPAVPGSGRERRNGDTSAVGGCWRTNKPCGKEKTARGGAIGTPGEDSGFGGGEVRREKGRRRRWKKEGAGLGLYRLLIALIANWRGEEGGQTRTGDASPDWEGASGATAG